jgi:hypothetical protein
MNNFVRRLLTVSNDELCFLLTCLEARCKGEAAVGELTPLGHATGTALWERLSPHWRAPDEAIAPAANDSSS